MSNTYCVYILASRSRNLYTGVTNNLARRIVEHREAKVPGFASHYRIFRLVHFEIFGDIRAAIAREKEIKGWRREKKVWLIKKGNPTWEDLAVGLIGDGKKQIPHPRSANAADRVRDDSAPAGVANPDEAEHIALSERDSLLVLNLLENPPTANTKLRTAIAAMRKPPWKHE